MKMRFASKSANFLTQKFESIRGQQWFSTPRKNPATLLTILVLASLALIGNVSVRLNQLDAWQSYETGTFMKNVPGFSTADAPQFLRHAQSISAGETLSSFNSIRLYPNFIEAAENRDQDDGLSERPLLSRLLAFGSKDDSVEQLLTFGNKLILFASAITAIMIFVCFGATKYWLEGAVAALGGGLSSAYLVRSSIGRIDTDQLNLGLLYFVFGLIVFWGQSRSWRVNIVWCLAASSCAMLFMWWYPKPQLMLIATCSLVWLLVCARKHFAMNFAGCIAFIALSGATVFNPFTLNYAQENRSVANFIYENALETVSEAQAVSLEQVLVLTTGSVEMGVVSLAGLAIFAFRHPVKAVALAPLLMFGLLNFVVGNRTVFFASPIHWFGVAFLMTTTARFIFSQIFEGSATQRHSIIASILGSCLAMVVAWANSPTQYVPRPSFSNHVLAGFSSLQNIEHRDNSVVATWWDYGYASMLYNEIPTLHDGGSQASPATHFVARAFLTNDQHVSAGILKFLSTKGHQGINAEASITGLQKQFDLAASAPSPDILVVVTGQMAGWMSSISQIGNWDIETGTPITPRGNNTGPQVFYEPLNCRLAGYPKRLNCAGAAFDLEQGLINGVPALSGWAHSQDGEVVRGKSFDNDGDFALQIVQNGNRINAYFLHRQLFESTFNELYYLGQIDHPSLSLHYDDYPHIRIYKLDGTPRDRSDS